MKLDLRVVAALAALSIACGGSSNVGTLGPVDATADGQPGSGDDAGDASASTADAGSDGAEPADSEASDANDANETALDATLGDATSPDAMSPPARDAAIDGEAPDATPDGATADAALVDAALDGAVADAAPDALAEASAPSNLPLGSSCTANGECASDECVAVVPGASSVCVTPCTTESDCTPFAGFFCDPSSAGAASGYCVQQSPEHCASCATNTDCGSLSETCFEAPGDNELACHVDCSIAGADACPSDYSCVDETVNGIARKLCRPTVVPTCLDANGGFCDRVTAPQSCGRSNAAGTCTGDRTCDAVTSRYGTCAAPAPACKTDCSVQDPAGCTESVCAAATETPTNCGTCGNICPGYQEPSDNVTCQSNATCTFSCQGEHYDVDGSPADGCEAVDSPTGNHTSAAAADLGSLNCDNTSTFPNLSGTLLSDARVHEEPAIVGFDVITGSAPDWYKIKATGGVTCQDDLALTLVVTGASNPACYELTVTGGADTYAAQTNAAGTATLTEGAGAYSDGATLDLEVQKTCGGAVGSSVTYTVTGHL